MKLGFAIRIRLREPAREDLAKRILLQRHGTVWEPALLNEAAVTAMSSEQSNLSQMVIYRRGLFGLQSRKQVRSLFFFFSRHMLSFQRWVNKDCISGQTCCCLSQEILHSLRKKTAKKVVASIIYQLRYYTRSRVKKWRKRW